MTLETTTIDGFPGPVILTEGMTTANGQRIYGVFADEEDARSEGADELALGTIGPDQLTDEQRALAARNTERLGE